MNNSEIITKEKKECCPHLEEILTADEIIARHNLDNHKWFRHIQDDEEAKKDFIYNFGGLIEQMLCAYSCKDKSSCSHAKKYKSNDFQISNEPYSGKEQINSCAHINLLNSIQTKVITDNLETHKWYRHIKDDSDAMFDFLKDFSGIMREVVCGYICNTRFSCDTGLKYIPNDVSVLKKYAKFCGYQLKISLEPET